MEKPQEILDPAKGVSLPTAKEMREFAEKNKDYYITEEIYNIIIAINNASQKGQLHTYYVHISNEAKQILEQKGYMIDFDMARNMPSYKISW
jgi:hypothetical protein